MSRINVANFRHPDGTDDNITLDSSGRVGVGTTSPISKVHIQRSAVANAPSRDNALYLENNANCEITMVGNPANDCQIRFGTSSNSFKGALEYQLDVDALLAYINGSERLRIDSSGRLGIGNSSPGSFYSGSNQLVVGNTGDQGITIKTGTSNIGRLHFADGTTGNEAYRGRIEYVHASDYMQFGTAGRNSDLVIDSSGNVGIGTASPASELHIQGALSGGQLLVATNQTNATNKYGTFGTIHYTNAEEPALGVAVESNVTNNHVLIGGGLGEFNAATNVRFYTAANNTTTVGTERARIDSSGRLLVGTSNARSKFFNSSDYSGLLQIEGRTDSTRVISFVYNTSGPQQPLFVLGKSRGTAAGSNTVVQNNDNLGTISFQGADGTELVEAARISCEVDATPGANDMPGRLTFSTTADGASNAVERMRIVKDGHIYIGRTNDSATAAGTSLYADGFARHNRDSNTVMILNRGGNDGSIINFQHAGTTEGSISVSGTTVSYNGAHLSRWSQLPGGVERTEILRGSVLSNIDEMCDWGEEENEQLNRMKVSDVEGDRNVSGVFQAWDDDDDTYTNDFYCAMTGDFVIRIAQGVTVERGDLLMSAGDGTAKPQDDDIIRSKTIAKVTSTHVSCTYDDGSYCVPCVLMAC
jgi:hypothetical protein